ncbi:MAG: KH domain-containing protein, partial [Acidilobaceae archaeon]
MPIDSKIRPRMYVKIPPDRLGAVIGSEGRVKKEISSKLGVAISIDTENSVAVVEAENENISPVNVVKAADI